MENFLFDRRSVKADLGRCPNPAFAHDHSCGYL